jgi:PAS domain S-box-containing protein
MTLLLGTVLILGWVSSKKVREVVTEDFNQQQLLLAKHAAIMIGDSLNHLERELYLLSFSPSIQYAESVFMGKRMEIAFSSIEDGGVEIRFIENKNKKTHVVNSQGYRTVSSSREDRYCLEWAMRRQNKGNKRISDVYSLDSGSNNKKLVVSLSLPVWQVSVDEAHPVAQNKFSGALMFLIDVTKLTGDVAKEIRSGKTGYAWVIDNKGTFLFHHEKEFIGKNAFEVRKGKMPSISFARINEIQKEKMLKGEEGTSWYISGWHRGQGGEMNKLIAFAPIKLDQKAESRIWSVAVVAPVSEVEGAIHSIYIQQFSLQALVFFAILLGGLSINIMILRWSSLLEQEVEKKTKELRKSEIQYRSVVENARDIIFTLDKEDRLLSINEYGYNFFKKRPEEILGHNILELLPDECAERQMNVIKEVFAGNTSKQLTCPAEVDGKEYWLSTNFSGFLDENGNVFSVLAIARDITERKKMEEQMSHTEKLASMGTLAAGVAHEINNPLAIILGFTDLLLEKAALGSEEHDILTTIERQATTAKRVVENLLSFARYKEYKEEEIDLNKNLETVLSVTRNTLLLNRISVDQYMQDDLPAIKVDSGELQQVFFNIINNAIYAMKGGGGLTIITKAFNNQVEIRFADTGPGIKKEYRTRIFDPLFTTKDVGEGTGLGLSVSYGIVTKYGGSITFETKTKEESEETGTTFIITLPVKAGIHYSHPIKPSEDRRQFKRDKDASEIQVLIEGGSFRSYATDFSVNGLSFFIEDMPSITVGSIIGIKIEYLYIQGRVVWTKNIDTELQVGVELVRAGPDSEI